MMQYDVNQLQLSGKIVAQPTLHHTAYGEAFMGFSVLCQRLSGALDELPVLAPQGLIRNFVVRQEESYEIHGQIRSYNEYSEEGTHLRLKVFAKQIFEQRKAGINSVVLEGYLCKAPNFRVTPFGREIADLLLAVNRFHGKSDYIPVIVWGKNARFARQLQVGQKVRIEGRFQSRIYEKALGGEHTEKRVAYEVSAGAIYLIL